MSDVMERIQVGNSEEKEGMVWDIHSSARQIGDDRQGRDDMSIPIFRGEKETEREKEKGDEKKKGNKEKGNVEEKHLRSFLKAFSWRITATLSTLVISYIVTGSLEVATIIGGIEFFSKMLLYYFHERIWGRSSLGLEVKKPPPDYQI